MTTTTEHGWPTGYGDSTEVVVVSEPLFTGDERSALVGFLAGYSGLTRDAYALDLRWTATRSARCWSPPDSAPRANTH
jgi:hypothetical protein